MSIVANERRQRETIAPLEAADDATAAADEEVFVRTSSNEDNIIIIQCTVRKGRQASRQASKQLYIATRTEEKREVRVVGLVVASVSVACLAAFLLLVGGHLPSLVVVAEDFSVRLRRLLPPPKEDRAAARPSV